jgi:hypothetical protein
MTSLNILKLGSPISELELRGNTMIKILNDEEIKGMSLACKVSLLQFISVA